ncbi:MAG: hypothetical protein RBR15_09085 [Sphaerochaeta sp.]|nr:hypothetical protein [Sphaerochaeta sp.]
MQEEEKAAEKEKDEKKGSEKVVPSKKKLILSKAHVAMLSVSSTVLVFILAFSCYGCSYQPITPPTPEEAGVTFDRLYNSTWELDTAMGVTALTEMQGLPVLKFVIEGKDGDHESAATAMYLQGYPPTYVELVYREGYGFVIQSGNTVFAVKILYSASKDGKSETLTMIGNESNTHCYYLRK